LPWPECKKTQKHIKNRFLVTQLILIIARIRSDCFGQKGTEAEASTYTEATGISGGRPRKSGKVIFKQLNDLFIYKKTQLYFKIYAEVV
jgi:hypothetical protein